MPTTTDYLPPRLRSYGITADDLTTTAPAVLRETRNDLAAAIDRGATGDTLLVHQANLHAIDDELARRAEVTAKGLAPATYGADVHDPGTCGVCATIPAYLVARHNH